MSDRSELVLGASMNGVQKRTGRTSDWTQAMADRFVEVLADSCNVSLAARAIGRSVSNVYKQRSRDAAFRHAWDQALAIGYSKLEMMLLERALHGVEKVVTKRDGSTTVMRQYNDRTALALLRMHRENAAIANETVDDGEWQEARDRIVGRLARIRERDEGLETRSAAGDQAAIERG